ncbi:MAG TPA: hypothetical protein PLB21_12350 [Actinomycetota bacterium]|nr:hypothetical protein [Actinomycetota bacterium]
MTGYPVDATAGPARSGGSVPYDVSQATPQTCGGRRDPLGWLSPELLLRTHTGAIRRLTRRRPEACRLLPCAYPSRLAHVRVAE